MRCNVILEAVIFLKKRLATGFAGPNIGPDESIRPAGNRTELRLRQ